MNSTSIQWTDFTANPIRFRDQAGRSVWGCVKTSSGCANCYAESLAHRFKKGGPFTAAQHSTLTPYMDAAELRTLATSRKIAGKRVFVGDMTDIFGEWVTDQLLHVLFAVFALRSDVTFQVLTKRADRLRSYFADRATRHLWASAAKDLPGGRADGWQAKCDDSVCNGPWPLPNVWIGVSAENQQAADERIPKLLQTPAAVRFISAEPLLGPVDMQAVPIPGSAERHYDLRGVCQPLSEKDTEWDDWKYWTKNAAKLNWVIVGGESGSNARPCDVGWVRSIVTQCREAAVPVFVKQLGSVPYEFIRQAEYLVDYQGDLCAFSASVPKMDRISASVGRMVNTISNTRVLDHAGAEPTEWPEDLRVRQFPVEQR